MVIVVLHPRSVCGACWSSLALPIWVCVFSHFVLVRTLVIVPENRVAMAPRDWEESMNSTIIHSFHVHSEPLVPKISQCHQRHLHTSSPYSSSLVAELLVVVDFPWNTRVLPGPFRVKLLEWCADDFRTSLEDQNLRKLVSERAKRRFALYTSPPIWETEYKSQQGYATAQITPRLGA